jgi:hypothetical protein
MLGFLVSFLVSFSVLDPCWGCCGLLLGTLDSMHKHKVLLAVQVPKDFDQEPEWVPLRRLSGSRGCGGLSASSYLQVLQSMHQAICKAM